MKGTGPIAENRNMPKGQVTIVDALLDDQGEAHTELGFALAGIWDATGDVIILLARLNTAEDVHAPVLGQILTSIQGIVNGLHVSRVALDQARCAAVAVREAPAVRRARRDARKGNEERRQRERRDARVMVSHLRGEVAS